MTRHVLWWTLGPIVAIGGMASVAAGAGYKAELEEHWLRTLSPEERLLYTTRIHPTQDAYGAVDGVRHERFAFHTRRQRSPWWEVNLADDVEIARIDVYNGTLFPQRTYGLKILFSTDHETWEEVYDNAGKPFAGGKAGTRPLSVTFAGKKARWVRLQLAKKGGEFFHLAEVEVYAKGDEKTNVARGKFATQSSVHNMGTPSCPRRRFPPPLPPHLAGRKTDPRVKYAKYVTSEEIHKWLDIADKTFRYVRRSGVNVDREGPALEKLKARWGPAVRKGGKPGAPTLPADQYVAFYLEVRHLRRSVLLRHPDLQFKRILINRNAPTMYSHNGDQHVGRHSRVGPGLTILSDWKTSVQAKPMLPKDALPDGAYRNPDLHYDADKVLFAFCDHTYSKDPRNLRYFLYEAAVDGSWVRQLTGTKDDPLATSGRRATALIEDNDSCYLPDGDIMFISTRCQSYGRCHGGRYNPAWVLYRMTPGKNNIRQVSFNNENEYEPAVLNDGRIVFTRWEYTFRHEMYFHMLWWCHPDGTSISNFYGADTLHPMMVVEAAPVPNSNKVVAIAQGHHSYNTGTVILLDPAVGENGEEPVTRITPETPYSESRGWPKPHYSHPYPINEDLFLVSRANHRVHPQSAVTPPANNRAVYLIDSFGGREFIYEDPDVASVSPIPLLKRKRPPVLPTRLVPGQEYGTLFVQNVYVTRKENDPDGVIKPGMIEAIRVIALGNQPRAMPTGLSSTNYSVLPKRILGTVPVEADGSAFFKVPANTSFFLQTLDANGMAILTEKTFQYLQPGENRSCVGCHESPESAPRTTELGRSTRRSPRELAPPAGPSYAGGNSFHRSVQPVLDRYCIRCHGLEKKAGKIDFIGDGATIPKGLHGFLKDRDLFTEGMMAIVRRGDHHVGYKPYMSGRDKNRRDRNVSIPRRFFAYSNKVAHMLVGNEALAGKEFSAAHKDLKVDRQSVLQVIEWMDLNCQGCGDLFPNKIEKRKLDAKKMDALRALAGTWFGAKFAKAPDRALVNPAQPDQSRVLLAPLPADKGGWGQFRGYRDRNDPRYTKMARLVDAAIIRLPNENTRGWRPTLEMGGADKWVLEERKRFFRSLGREFPGR